jgi:hypothetical protein
MLKADFITPVLKYFKAFTSAMVDDYRIPVSSFTKFTGKVS